MSQILVRNLDPNVVEQLKERAARNRRSLEAEIRSILEDLAQRQTERDEAIRFADAMRASSPPQTSDSTDLIREDRDS
jgi:plasmid stability protein